MYWTRKRFFEILRHLHFSDWHDPRSHSGSPDHDRTFKVKALLDLLQESLDSSWEPGNRLSYDESTIKFGGQNVMIQYNQSKPIQWGFRVNCLCDAKTGALLAFELYSGAAKKDGKTKVLAGAAADGEKAVASLAKKNSPVAKAMLKKNDVTALTLIGLLHRIKFQPSTILYGDNLFTSILLIKTLIEWDIMYTGTLRANRSNKEFPADGAPTANKFMDLKAFERVSKVRYMLCMLWFPWRSSLDLSLHFLPSE
jgi:hypothetical protein